MATTLLTPRLGVASKSLEPVTHQDIMNTVALDIQMMQMQLDNIDPTSGTLAADTITEYTNGSGVTVNKKLILSNTLTLGSSGDIAVNTNKFTVTASSGNTSIAGTLGVTGKITASAELSVATFATLIPINPSTKVPANNSFFVDSTNANTLSWKDNSGSIHTVNLTP